MNTQIPPSAIPEPPAIPSRPESLWPQEIQPVKVKPPATILKEQASLLGQMNQNIVRAEVRLKDASSSDRIAYAFGLVAPALSNYTFWLFEIEHKPTELYPVDVQSEALPPKDQYIGRWRAMDESEFKALLKQLFSDQRTTTAIQSLKAQSEGLPVPAY